MGTYVYSLKKASRKIKTKNGVAKVQHFSYAYKEYFGFWPCKDHNLMVGRVAAQAQKAFSEYDGGYIVRVDVKDRNGKLNDLDGASVFKNLKHPVMYDDIMDKRMEYVGILHKEGRSYVLHEKVQ